MQQLGLERAFAQFGNVGIEPFGQARDVGQRRQIVGNAAHRALPLDFPASWQKPIRKGKADKAIS